MCVCVCAVATRHLRNEFLWLPHLLCLNQHSTNTKSWAPEIHLSIEHPHRPTMNKISLNRSWVENPPRDCMAHAYEPQDLPPSSTCCLTAEFSKRSAMQRTCFLPGYVPWNVHQCPRIKRMCSWVAGSPDQTHRNKCDNNMTTALIEQPEETESSRLPLPCWSTRVVLTFCSKATGSSLWK